MKRRAFIYQTAVVAAWPFAARAQPKTMRVIGYLSSKSPGAEAGIVAAILESLSQRGFVEGRNLAIEFRWADGDYTRLPQQAAELVSRSVHVLMTSGLPATLAAQKATSSIPIVFRLAIDPVAFGLAESLNRPGGNLTGVTMLFDPLTPKKLQLLQGIIPPSASIGFLINPNNQNAPSHRDYARKAAQRLGLHLEIFEAGTLAELNTVFAAAHKRAIGGVLVGDDPFFDVSSKELVEAAARYGVPTMYYVRDFTAAGGLISYGPSFSEMSHQAGEYAARILEGASPKDLPVGQPTKVELIVNVKTAKALGLSIPPSVLAGADEVIE